MEVHQNPARFIWGALIHSSPCSKTSKPSWSAMEMKWKPRYFALKGINRG